MAERPIWRGQLRLALVSCPVALYSARHEAAALHFHFINPKTGNRVRTLRDAIRKTGRVALSRVVIARRERAIAIMPMERGLVVHTLQEASDMKDPKALFEDVPAAKLDADMIDLAVQLIERQTAPFDLSDMEDRYEARLRQVIEAKLKGHAVQALQEPKDNGTVIDLMAALKRSLSAGKDAGAAAETPRQAAAATPTPKRPTRKRA